MSLRWIARIGPLGDADHGDPTFSWVGEANEAGFRTASISGVLPWPKAHALSELTVNPANKRTEGGHTGLLEWLIFDDDLLRPFTGLYLLKPATLGTAEQKWSVSGPAAGIVPFSLSAVFVGGNRQPVLACTARARANDFTLATRALIPTPWWSPDPAGEPFLVSPGGALFTREYDAASPRSLATSSAATRRMSIYAMAPSLVPVLAMPALRQESSYDGSIVPRWASDRGGDVRAYDRSSGEDVGPGHFFRSSTDIKVCNGLVEFWIGSTGLPPYLTVSAVAGGTWAEVGYLYLGGPGNLISARLTRVGPDAVTVTLSVFGAGEVAVTLRRGERLLEVEFPTRGPVGTPDYAVRWAGVPPTSRLVAAPSAAAHFGNGLDVPLAGSTDIHLLWPPTAPPTSWSTVLWFRAAAAASAGTAGVLTLFDAAGANAASVYLDPTTHRWTFAMGANSLTSPVQTYSAGADIALGIRFSTARGMALSYSVAGGPVTHVANAAFTTPSAAIAYLAYLTSGAVLSIAPFGTGSFGAGSFGGSVLGGSSSAAGGVIDNHMIFDSWLTDARMAALLTATSPLAGLAEDEGHMVWYAPYDARCIPVFSAVAGGRSYEATTAGGTTRSPDANGLTKGLAYLDATGRKGIAAFLATTASYDDLADHQAEFAAEWDHPVVLR